MAWWQYAIPKCKNYWMEIYWQIYQIHMSLLFCIVSGQWRFTLLFKLQRKQTESVSSGLDFFILNKGFTNVTNQERHPKQMERQSKKKQSKQLLREYRKANTWYSWFLWLWQSSSRWENNSRPEKTSPVKPCRCQDKCWMSELERKREGVWASEWLL